LDAGGETPLGATVSQQESVVVQVPERTYTGYLPLISR
jgi:hypothetical protein